MDGWTPLIRFHVLHPLPPRFTHKVQSSPRLPGRSQVGRFACHIDPWSVTTSATSYCRPADHTPEYRNAGMFCSVATRASSDFIRANKSSYSCSSSAFPCFAKSIAIAAERTSTAAILVFSGSTAVATKVRVALIILSATSFSAGNESDIIDVLHSQLTEQP